MEGREVHHFDDVETMAATSDLVVRAEVLRIRPGRWTGSEQGGGRQQAREVTLRVEQVLRGSGGANPGTIIVDEWGWDEKGHGYQFAGVTWSKEGDRGIYFLSETEKPGNWRLINSQGRALADGQRLDSTAEEGDQVGARIEAVTPAQLEAQVLEAARAVESGKLKPADKPVLVSGTNGG